MTLHEEFYDFAKRVRNRFEELVRTGCDHIGEFSIRVDEQHSKSINRFIIGDNTLIIFGIVKDENYSIHPTKNSERDISVFTNTIKVIVEDIMTNERKEIEVTPDILDLQNLSTYISGGFSAYKQ